MPATSRCLVLLVFLALAAGPGVAQTAPRLVGSYDFAVVQDDGGENVQVELRLRLYNLATEPLEDASLVLLDSYPTQKQFAVLSGITVGVGAFTDRSESVSIPRSEYELWRRGVLPKLYLENADGRGDRARIQLRRGALPGALR